MAPVWETQQWQVAVPAGAELGERPVWDASAGAMIWVDILAGRRHRGRAAATCWPPRTGSG
jgi:sugar lactone lactonase YvrE